MRLRKSLRREATLETGGVSWLTNICKGLTILRNELSKVSDKTGSEKSLRELLRTRVTGP